MNAPRGPRWPSGPLERNVRRAGGPTGRAVTVPRSAANRTRGCRTRFCRCLSLHEVLTNRSRSGRYEQPSTHPRTARGGRRRGRQASRRHPPCPARGRGPRRAGPVVQRRRPRPHAPERRACRCGSGFVRPASLGGRPACGRRGACPASHSRRPPRYAGMCRESPPGPRSRDRTYAVDAPGPPVSPIPCVGRDVLAAH